MAFGILDEKPAYEPRRLVGAPIQIGPWLLFAGVAFLVALPVTFLILGSFSEPKIPGEISWAHMGLGNYVAVWGDPSTYILFYNTAIYVCGATVLGLALAASLAWLTERSDFPGKFWIYAGVPMMLATPGMLQAMAWVLLLSPHAGFINQFIERFGVRAINIYSLGGLIFVEGLRLVPTAFLMLAPLLRSMDPSLEEAALTSGASRRAVLLRITVRLMAPGLLSVAIYQAMTALEVFEVPGVLGLPADIHVFSTKIYSIMQSASFLPVYGRANALAMIYLLIAVATTFGYSRVIARQERFMTLSGRGYRPRLVELGWRRLPAAAFVAGFFSLSVLLPLIVFAYVSLLPFVEFPSRRALRGMSLRAYRSTLSSPFFGIAIWNTIIVVVVTAVGVTLLSFLISLVVTRTKFSARRLLDQIAFAPHAIPGIVLGLSFMWAFLEAENFKIPLFGGIWSICIAFTVSYMSYGTRAMNAAMLQIHKDLEDAAFSLGASTWKTTIRIFAPLMRSTFVGVLVWVGLQVARSASIPLLLYQGNDNQVLSVLVWSMWNDGDIQSVSAIGTMTILALGAFAALVQLIGFGRDRLAFNE